MRKLAARFISKRLSLRRGLIALAIIFLLLGLVVTWQWKQRSAPERTTAARLAASHPSVSPSSPPVESAKAERDEARVSERESARGRRREREEEEEEEIEREREELEERNRYDKPDEAAEFYRAQRLPEGETELPIERYLTALEQMRDLPQYSTATRTLLPSRRATETETRLTREAEADGWKALGPGNVGGRTRALLIHPTDPNVIYAGAASGGVWKTTDGGASWKPLADFLPTLAVNALAMEPGAPETIYAGTGEGFFNSDARRGAGIFKTTDGGLHWQQLPNTANANFYFVNDLVVGARNRVYAATRTGVWRSPDGGATWTLVNPADNVNGGCLDLALRADGTRDVVFAACGTSIATNNPADLRATIYRNTDAAGTGAWEAVFSEPGMGRTSLAIAPSNPDIIYAAVSETGATGPAHSLHAVLRSTSGGATGTWTKQVTGTDPKRLNTSLFTNPFFAFYTECGRTGSSQLFHQGWYDNVIAVDPRNPNIVWVGGIDLFRSDDGGANWGMASFWNLGSGLRYVHADQHAIAFHPQYDGVNNTTIFVAGDGGIYRSDTARLATVTGERAPCSSDRSGIKWTALNSGYEATQFYHGAVAPGGTNYYGGAQDNGVIAGSDADGVNGWRELISGDGGQVAVAPNNPKTIYAELTGLSLRKTITGTSPFTSAITGISNSGFNFIVPFVLDPRDPSRLWMGGRQMWVSSNSAQTWSQASTDLSASATAIAVAPTDSNFVVVGTSNGTIHRTDVGLNTSADTTWFAAQPRSGFVSSVTFDPGNRDIVYATYSTFGGRHVWRSYDRGANWSAIDEKLPDLPVNCLLVDPTDARRLYLGTDLGIFVSPDNGATWSVENGGFINAPVVTLALGTLNGATYVYAFTHGRGAWRVALGAANGNGACTASLVPNPQTFGADGGRGSVMVNTSRGDCGWKAESSAPWLTLSNPAGTGSAPLNFQVAASNEAQARSATITVADQTLTVTQTGPAASVSAATFKGDLLAPESIVAAFGAGLATTTQAATTLPLPTELAGTTVTVRDSLGTTRLAPLFFVSPFQVNYLMPAGTASGPATVTIISSAGGPNGPNTSGGIFSGLTRINRVAPGLFTVDSSGKGPAIGQALHVRGTTQSAESLTVWDDAQNRLLTRPIDLGDVTEQTFLILYGTGIRLRSNLSAVTATIGGVPAIVFYAGAIDGLAGLDQINILIPRDLIGRGEVEVVLTVEGQVSNAVRVNVK